MEIETDIKITLNEKEKQLFDFLLEFVKAKNIQVVLRSAGGWVRDKILGKECHDIDITLDTMTGEQLINLLIEYLKEKGQEDLISGHGIIKSNPDKSKHLETVTFKIFGYDIDVANLRHEEYATNSRIPTMKFGTPLQDAERRDLTINSMFYNINTCQIEDFTGKGLSDLQNKVIRTPLDPTQTFIDDPLRILRTFRFATKYQFTIVPDIIESLKQEEIRNSLEQKVSRERVRTELEKILRDKNVELGLNLIFQNNLWSIVFQMPENQCDELKDKDFYNQKQLESYNLAIRSVQELKNIQEMPILSQDFQEQDVQLLFLMSAISFPFTKIQYKKNKTIMSLPQYLAFESLKFPDKALKVCTIITQTCENALKIQEIIKKNFDEEFNNIAQLIKKLGNTWELAFTIAKISDSLQYKDEYTSSYDKLIQYIYSNKIERVYEMKPLIDGKEIMGVFELDKQGPVVGKINTNIFLWQAKNMDKQKDDLIAEIVKNKQKFML
ncbi:hypothetical protein ABPG73_015947 [Tetrahymena malaccensis]